MWILTETQQFFFVPGKQKEFNADKLYGANNA